MLGLRVALFALCTALASGCKAIEPPHAAADLQPEPVDSYPADDPRRVMAIPAQPVLDQDRQDRALAAMQSVAAGYEPADPPAAAADGIRWVDLDWAVRAACDDQEMAVLRREGKVDDPERRFWLVTIDDRPGKLVVRRVDGPEVYTATATIGRRENDTEAAAALLKALDGRLRQRGKKKTLNR